MKRRRAKKIKTEKGHGFYFWDGANGSINVHARKFYNSPTGDITFSTSDDDLLGFISDEINDDMHQSIGDIAKASGVLTTRLYDRITSLEQKVEELEIKLGELESKLETE